MHDFTGFVLTKINRRLFIKLIFRCRSTPVINLFSRFGRLQVILFSLCKLKENMPAYRWC